VPHMHITSGRSTCRSSLPKHRWQQQQQGRVDGRQRRAHPPGAFQEAGQGMVLCTVSISRSPLYLLVCTMHSDLLHHPTTKGSSTSTSTSTSTSRSCGG
jgi:hypothetical protein